MALNKQHKSNIIKKYNNILATDRKLDNTGTEHHYESEIATSQNHEIPNPGKGGGEVDGTYILEFTVNFLSFTSNSLYGPKNSGGVIP